MWWYPGTRETAPSRRGDGEGNHPVVGADVNQDQGVGVVAAGIGISGMQVLQDRPRQIVAVLVFPRVQADQQDVHRPPLERGSSERSA
ncbi:transcriptional regulator, LytR family domain protein [Mycobacterium xenopi 4042]|uniref:Transcriptional regulator, LytR family domain protein n=1 Tax=Mycobacterium xenopi 4042 TaxID=1299334 RepID=X7ZTW9_MYCXE|nr:transcriptional regulator, LytR family domain protein [Mycobacterium xenopi 4042]